MHIDYSNARCYHNVIPTVIIYKGWLAMETKTKKAEETKNRILSSAQKLFHKKGFEATSIREIVEDAGCAKGTFYLYF